jgi:hypothetical protein
MKSCVLCCAFIQIYYVKLKAQNKQIIYQIKQKGLCPIPYILGTMEN